MFDTTVGEGVIEIDIEVDVSPSWRGKEGPCVVGGGKVDLRTDALSPSECLHCLLVFH